ncbi:tRNA (N6-threonylcarbamoyladenosine(37)-N6)-methyltransferase TrmO [Shewanella sp. WXL01]|uniref:tRNA (N6-threonylcarbamoyladenosine(37)-N6)-methyltransferase TrmO n=1 Tax=Shewanella sp. WXL01 TaxID=2709721 RepID=UPI001438416F|nr:tRNA (N6-threonylcarbamoyladenosine(37)-N6)-methyltransferase TrmO [Shewanella sp. WXL01]NKF51111.1 tRNA (N6-threonylcarbamoyladenosine(37)-N6)-methyltransferase TrmO [Shewanella sp. WXL01]
MSTSSFSNLISAVAICRTPYKQKFGIPRQPGLVDTKGYIELVGEFNNIDCVRGIEQYSHLWLVFSFHENLAQGWKTTVRPPRLGGNEKLGVFATRATFRPNGLGQSVVKLHRVIQQDGKIRLEISGMDLVDKTPIIDIKPYIPFSDAISDAKGGMAQEKPELISVEFSEQALIQISQYEAKHEHVDQFKLLIEGVLSQDPRPAYKKAKVDPKLYQLALYDRDIFWRVIDNIIVVEQLVSSKVIDNKEHQ